MLDGLSRSDAPLVIVVLGALLVVPLMAVAGYLWRAAARTPNVRTIRLLSIGLAASAVGLAVVLWRFMLLVR